MVRYVAILKVELIKIYFIALEFKLYFKGGNINSKFKNIYSIRF